MKSILFLAMTILSTHAFADSDSAVAVEAFKADKAVLEAIKNVSNQLGKSGEIKVTVSKPSAVFMAYSCGTKGCTSRYLVSVMIAPRIVNSQGRVVAASVFMWGSRLGRVSVLSPIQTDKILNLLN